MTQVTHPPKEAVRTFMAQRQKDRTPPPTPERIREELGWQMLREQETTQPR